MVVLTPDEFRNRADPMVAAYVGAFKTARSPCIIRNPGVLSAVPRAPCPGRSKETDQSRSTMNILQFIQQNHIEVLESPPASLAGRRIHRPRGAGRGPARRLDMRCAAFTKPVLGTANVIQTIPSLACSASFFLRPGSALAPTVWSSCAHALRTPASHSQHLYRASEVWTPRVVEAGRGMGMTDRQLCGRCKFRWR